MRKKTAQMGPPREVEYDEAHWNHLSALRQTAEMVLETLEGAGIEAIVHGSVARGDVSPTSDVDVFIPRVVPSYAVEVTLDPLHILERRLVQATPRALPKAHLEVEGAMVTIPLSPPTQREVDFYRFGGAINLKGLREGRRVAGVDKRLMLIRPSPRGHVEEPISDLSPGVVARIVGVGQDIVEERIRVLTRRAEVGRTGVYVDRVLSPEEGFEQILERIAATDPAVRRRIRG